MPDGRLVLIFGPPGSGKSTQGQLLAKKMGWNWISTGQILKKFASEELWARLNNGELATDDEVNPLADMAVKENTIGGQTLVIDGYPRNAAQAERLIGNWPKVLAVFLLNVPKEEVCARIEARGRDGGDDRATTEKRFDIFEANIGPIRNVLEKAGVHWIEVDGVGDVEEINNRIMEKIKNVYGR